MEIERKFLVAKLPANLESFPHTEIEQGYLCTSPTLRVRRVGDSFILTVKEKLHSDSSAIVNREEEFSLSGDQYAMLKAKCDGNMVLKTRYRIPLEGGLTAELDIFHGTHDGLRLVEVEFPDQASADSFLPPVWFASDVSDDHRYRNSWLAHHDSIL